MKHEELVEAFKQAKKAAKKLEKRKDVGSCNRDSVVIFPNRRRKAYEAAAIEVELPFYMGTWGGSRVLFLGFGTGQGTRNTLMVEAACEVLKQHGIDATVFYRLD